MDRQFPESTGSSGICTEKERQEKDETDREQKLIEEQIKRARLAADEAKASTESEQDSAAGTSAEEPVCVTCFCINRRRLTKNSLLVQ